MQGVQSLLLFWFREDLRKVVKATTNKGVKIEVSPVSMLLTLKIEEGREGSTPSKGVREKRGIL